MIGHWKLRGFGFWAVDERSSNQLVGGVGLWYPEGWPEPELAYWLIPEARGKGYATEAGLKSIEAASEVVRLQTLVSYINPGNDASIRVAERLGGAYGGTLELPDKGTHRVYRYSLEL